VSVCVLNVWNRVVCEEDAERHDERHEHDGPPRVVLNKVRWQIVISAVLLNHGTDTDPKMFL
jgi:hypothetical protein